jgi:hypothetical protein
MYGFILIAFVANVFWHLALKNLLSGSDEHTMHTTTSRNSLRQMALFAAIAAL